MNYSTKFARIQLSDITDKTGITDENLIMNITRNMIANHEIYAEYFSSSKAITFNQQANIDAIDNLMEVYKDWEQNKIGKKDSES